MIIYPDASFVAFEDGCSHGFALYGDRTRTEVLVTLAPGGSVKLQPGSRFTARADQGRISTSVRQGRRAVPLRPI